MGKEKISDLAGLLASFFIAGFYASQGGPIPVLDPCVQWLISFLKIASSWHDFLFGVGLVLSIGIPFLIVKIGVLIALSK